MTNVIFILRACLKSKGSSIFGIIFAAFFLTGCHNRSYLLEPVFDYTPQKKQFSYYPSAFPALSPEEERQEWGKELKIGICFGRELDLYRAITAFKRALILMPLQDASRRTQIEFYIVQAYYLGNKHFDAVDYFEQSSLPSVASTFPAFRELVILLYDSYLSIGQCEKAEAVMSLIEKGDSEMALNLKLYTATSEGNLLAIEGYSSNSDKEESARQLLSSYCSCAKSARRAQVLNAVLPGAGYYYVGQKKTALTSFMVNLFTTAAVYYFFERGNWGAGSFAASLELGWYFGGINGAGLAAKEYNQIAFQKLGKEFLIRNKLFPVLMLETSF